MYLSYYYFIKFNILFQGFLIFWRKKKWKVRKKYIDLYYTICKYTRAYKIFSKNLRIFKS